MSLRSVMMALLLCVLATVSRPALAEFTQEQTINQALATVERMKNDHNFQKNFQQEQAGAKAVLIVPSL